MAQPARGRINSPPLLSSGQLTYTPCHVRVSSTSVSRPGAGPVLRSRVTFKGKGQLSTAPRVAVQTRDISGLRHQAYPSCRRTTNPDTAPGSSMGPDVPIASTCYMVAAQTTDIFLAFGGNAGHRHRHRPQLQQDMAQLYPDMAFGGSQDLTMASSHLPVPHHFQVFIPPLPAVYEPLGLVFSSISSPLCILSFPCLHRTSIHHRGTHGGCLGVFLPASMGRHEPVCAWSSFFGLPWQWRIYVYF